MDILEWVSGPIALRSATITGMPVTAPEMSGGAAASRARPRRRGRLVLRQFVDDRAVRPLVAVAMMGEMLQRRGHRLDLTRLLLELGDMLERDALDVGAGARAIAP